MVSHKYTRSEADHCIYVGSFLGGKYIILLLYVDDILIVGQDPKLIQSLKKDMSKFFDMKDLGAARQILGMKIICDRRAKKLWVSQEKYKERVLERFNMKIVKPVGTPLGAHFKLNKKTCPSIKGQRDDKVAVPYSLAVGSLMNAIVCTRPDIAHSVEVVNRILMNPGRYH